jgi:proteasome lid subunit RPN8/RPN11
MNVVSRLLLSAALSVTAFCVNAASPGSECLNQDVEAHVREQFVLYGPQSANHEYFGFIYVHEGVIGSAVVRSRTCQAAKCVVDSAKALQLIPKSATVLGEWHTHPHGGSASLSKEDVRGAYSNRHISCYLAFYSTPSGEIYAWNPNRISVPIAMASRAPVGNYKQAVVASGS